MPHGRKPRLHPRQRHRQRRVLGENRRGARAMNRARPVIRRRPVIHRRSVIRLRTAAAVAIAGLVAGLATGCVPAAAWSSLDACRAASAVTATPTDDVDGLAEALEVLGTH